MTRTDLPSLSTVVPPYLLNAIAENGATKFPKAAVAARSFLAQDQRVRELRAQGLRTSGDGATARTVSADQQAAGAGPNRQVHDAQNKEDLPGVLARAEGDAPVADEAVNEAYDGLGDSYALFSEAFGRDSLDDNGMPLIASVHYGQDYDNAFWDGRLLVFGDGDGEVFTSFTGSLSIIGHELSHGVITNTADLEYFDQPGALNEHISDVFGALTEQHAAGQSAEDATWLIGAGIFTEAVTGKALRSMLEPGTAYDDGVLGKDPQPAHMDDFVTTESDNGGVHLNAGIPNRAFAVAATSLGGPAWETVGPVWYAVLTGPAITTKTDFAEFAALTVAEAAEQFGEGSDVHDAVIEGWTTVGVDTGASQRGNRGSSW
ncbi:MULTISPECIES: M4 family metallopeptidase [unclassified Brevibacterium]|uniref:M4 family metallopeptidase n=1 Tax=unclassified Brevibacterium TaxID=2614124 RepID=UPI001BA7803C|nr:M4 family metallopeptidase [Brevibacterium sp. W7.2]